MSHNTIKSRKFSVFYAAIRAVIAIHLPVLAFHQIPISYEFVCSSISQQITASWSVAEKKNFEVFLHIHTPFFSIAIIITITTNLQAILSIERCLFRCELSALRTCTLVFLLLLSSYLSRCWQVEICVSVWLMQWICDDGYIPYVFTSIYGK